MPKDSAPWRRAIRLREWLRSNPELAIRFEEAKVERWKCVEGSPERYEADKAIVFAHLEEQMDARES